MRWQRLRLRPGKVYLDEPARRERRTAVERMSFRAARSKILAEANRHSQMRVFTKRTLQQAVFLVRQRGLVKPEVLEAAGFRSRPVTNPHQKRVR